MAAITNWTIFKRALSQIIYRSPAIICFGVLSMCALVGSVTISVYIGALILDMAGIMPFHNVPYDIRAMTPIEYEVPYYTIGFLVLLIAVTLLICDAIVHGWFYTVVSKVAQDEPVMTRGVFWKGVRIAFPLFAARIMFTLGVFIGSLCFIIPGIVAMLSWYVFPFVIVEHEYGSWHALVQSYRMMRGHRIQLCILLLGVSWFSAILHGIIGSMTIVGNPIADVCAVVLRGIMLIYTYMILPVCAAHYYYALRNE